MTAGPMWLKPIINGGEVWGVCVSSRCDVQAELQLMATVAARLPAWARQITARIWCDSKATCVYAIELVEGSDRIELTKPLADVLHPLLVELTHGYNGVFIGETYWLDPWWDELDDDGESLWLDEPHHGKCIVAKPVAAAPLPPASDDEEWVRWIQGRP